MNIQNWLKTGINKQHSTVFPSNVLYMYTSCNHCAAHIVGNIVHLQMNDQVLINSRCLLKMLLFECDRRLLSDWWHVFVASYGAARGLEITNIGRICHLLYDLNHVKICFQAFDIERRTIKKRDFLQLIFGFEAEMPFSLLRGKGADLWSLNVFLSMMTLVSYTCTLPATAFRVRSHLLKILQDTQSCTKV